jgi:hypothetical protein
MKALMVVLMAWQSACCLVAAPRLASVVLVATSSIRPDAGNFAVSRRVAGLPAGLFGRAQR